MEERIKYWVGEDLYWLGAAGMGFVGGVLLEQYLNSNLYPELIGIYCKKRVEVKRA